MSIRVLNRPDAWFTGDGDLLIDETGDIKSTYDSGDRLEGLRQVVLHRVISESSAWRLHPQLSAGIERFMGDAVNDELIEALSSSVSNALTVDLHLEPADFSLQVFELLNGIVALLIYIDAAEQDAPVLTVAYNTQNGSVARVR